MHRLMFALTMVVLFFVGYCSSGCASTPMSRARTVLAQTDNATHLVDGILRARYAAVSASGDLDAIRRYNRTTETLLLTHAALLSAELALDDIEANDDPRIGEIMACVAGAVMRLVDALPAVGVEMPEALAMLLRAVTGLSAAACDPADHLWLPSTSGMAEVP